MSYFNIIVVIYLCAAYVIRIIFICPIFAVSSALALAFIDSAEYILVVRDLYEAVVVYSFLNLILEFCGGETDCVYQMENEPPLTMPCPLCFLPPMSRDLMYVCKKILNF